jgi:hypothetical protein
MTILFLVHLTRHSDIKEKKIYLKHLFNDVSEQYTLKELEYLLKSPEALALSPKSQEDVEKLTPVHYALQKAHRDSKGYRNVYGDVEDAFTKLPPKSLQDAKNLLRTMKEVLDRIEEGKRQHTGVYSADMNYLDAMINALDAAGRESSGSRSKSYPGKKRGNSAVKIHAAAEVGIIPKEYSLAHVMRGETYGSRKSRRAKTMG